MRWRPQRNGHELEMGKTSCVVAVLKGRRFSTERSLARRWRLCVARWWDTGDGARVGENQEGAGMLPVDKRG